MEELGVDMLTIAGHKLYAPKGVGALVIKSDLIGKGVSIDCSISFLSPFLFLALKFYKI